jgi:20S proteasome alpha/beta subunit
MIITFRKELISAPKAARIINVFDAASGKEKAVTIVAGFKCYQGIVLCADTQETASGLSKRNIPKLRFEPNGNPHEGDTLAAAFCGASDNGPFIDKVIESAREDAQLTTSLDEACAEIEKSIKRLYKEFGHIYQSGFCPTADLIYGVKMHGSCRLFSAHGPIVNEKQTYDSFGAGYYMADFLAGRMYHDYLNLRQCAILAAYILFQAKENVEGCGGDSHIAVLRDKGVSGLADWQHVDAMTELLKWADDDAGRILIDAADIELGSAEFVRKGTKAIEILDSLRTARKKQLDENRPIGLISLMGGDVKRPECDFLGLPKPSASNK